MLVSTGALLVSEVCGGTWLPRDCVCGDTHSAPPVCVKVKAMAYVEQQPGDRASGIILEEVACLTWNIAHIEGHGNQNYSVL